jgi:hypothetical protein
VTPPAERRDAIKAVIMVGYLADHRACGSTCTVFRALRGALLALGVSGHQIMDATASVAIDLGIGEQLLSRIPYLDPEGTAFATFAHHKTVRMN